MQFARKNPCWWRSCTGRTFARLHKPDHNPVGNVFALVPTKTRNKIPAKKPVVVASAKPAVKKAPAAVATANNATVVAKVAKVAKVASAANKAVKQIAKVASKIPTKTPAVVTVASVSRNIPIWEVPNKFKNTTAETDKKTVVASAKPVKPKATVKHDAVVHRVRNNKRIWTNKAAMRLANIIDGKINGGADLSAVWQTHWDNQFLYVRVDAVDDKFVRDSRNPWGDDSIELYIDADGSRSSKFDGKNDFHFIYRWKDKSVNLSRNSPRKDNLGIQQTMTRTNKGYSLETAIPWKTLGVKPTAGNSIGIDVQVNDDDSGRERDGKLSWHAKNDNSWTNPRNFGRLVLGI
jgi:uncharacterized protein YbaA (DUF1428 family)